MFRNIPKEDDKVYEPLSEYSNIAGAVKNATFSPYSLKKAAKRVEKLEVKAQKAPKLKTKLEKAGLKLGKAIKKLFKDDDGDKY